MVCPACGYALSAFDKECPRCKNLAQQKVAEQGISLDSVFPDPASVQPQPTPPAPQHFPPAPRHVPTAPPRTASSQKAEVDLPESTKLLIDIVVGIVTVGIFMLLFALLDPKNMQDFTSNFKKASQSQPASTPSSLTPTNNAQCGALNAEECTWVVQASQIIDNSVKINKIEGEGMVAFNIRMSASIDKATREFSMLPPTPPRCGRASALGISALSQASSLATYGSMATGFLTKEGAKQFDDDYNRKRTEVASAYGQCAAEFQRLYNSPN